MYAKEKYNASVGRIFFRYTFAAMSTTPFGWIYTFTSPKGYPFAVVQNRADEIIHEAGSYSEALAWAEANREAIDEPLYRPEYLAKQEPSYAAWLLARRAERKNAVPNLFSQQ
jgi:hypothetical protein